MKLQHTATCFPLLGGDVIRKDSLPGQTVFQPGDKWFPKDNVVERNRILIQEEDDLTVITGEVSLETLPFVETETFACDTPSWLDFTLDAPIRKTVAYYLFKDWWTRPAFTESPAEIPGRTELLLLQTEEGCMALSPALSNGAHLQFAPSGDPQTVRVQVTFTECGVSAFEGPVCYAFSHPDPEQALSGLMRRLCGVYGIPARDGRPYPETLEYLGWCSWDAFYREVDAEKLLAKCEEAREKEIPFGWMIIDDGWQSVDGNERMTAYGENREKFPEGLKACVERMRALCGVRTVGVWHAFAGYWSGVREGSPLWREKREDLIRNGRGQWLPAPEKAPDFYGTWHRYLSENGIGLLKVDSQSTLPVHYRGCVPYAEAAAGLHRGLDESAETWMQGNLINCMGMAKENIFSRPKSGVSRNSDDFFPRVEGSFEEHLLQNAYNSLYHGQIYYTDWDMFWTSHPQAEKHALLRAMSGGPVYVSDRVGESRKEILEKLCYRDGRVLRAELPAVPTADCIFADPAETGYLKLKNECGGVRYLLVYSYEAEQPDSEDLCREIPFTVRELERRVPGCSGETVSDTYAVFDVFSGIGRTAKEEEILQAELSAGGFLLQAAAPVVDGTAVFGRVDKHLMSHAVTGILRTENCLEVQLAEAGEFLFYAEKPPVRVTADGRDCAFTAGADGFCRVMADGTRIRAEF